MNASPLESVIVESRAVAPESVAFVRRGVRASFLAIYLVLCASGCSRFGPDDRREESLRILYDAQIEALRNMDEAFFLLGREYRRLYDTYVELDAPAKAESARRQAQILLERHERLRRLRDELERRRVWLDSGGETLAGAGSEPGMAPSGERPPTTMTPQLPILGGDSVWDVYAPTRKAPEAPEDAGDAAAAQPSR